MLIRSPIRNSDRVTHNGQFRRRRSTKVGSKLGNAAHRMKICTPLNSRKYFLNRYTLCNRSSQRNMQENRPPEVVDFCHRHSEQDFLSKRKFSGKKTRPGRTPRIRNDFLSIIAVQYFTLHHRIKITEEHAKIAQNQHI